MEILIYLNDKKMKFVIVFLLGCLSQCSYGQNSNIRIGNKNFKTLLCSDSLTIYLNLCENYADYLFVKKLLVYYDSITRTNELMVDRTFDSLDCTDTIDHLTVKQLKAILLKKGSATNVCILFCMEDKNKKLVGMLFLFEKRGFAKFLNRASMPSTRTYAGEKISLSVYDYHKYSEEFILIQAENDLSLIQASRFF